MDIPNLTARHPYGAPPAVERSQGKAAPAPGPSENASATAVYQYTRTELNVSILRASAEVSLSAGNQPLHLLFRAAIDELNVELEAELGENAIEKAAENPDDWTPEATAQRIVDFATGFLGAFRDKYSNLSEQEQNDSFMHTIRSGIEQGFTEARKILEGLQVLSGTVKEGVDATWDLVQKGLDDFEQSLKPPAEEAEKQDQAAE